MGCSSKKFSNLNSALKINQPTQIKTSMKELAPLESKIKNEVYRNETEVRKIISEAEKDGFALSNYKFDYRGDDFVYDNYNQNPDLVKENKFGYKVFFTRDEEFISEFAAMRTNAYLEEFKDADHGLFQKLQNGFDRNGRIVVVTSSKGLIGGARLMFSKECNYMSNEHPGTQFEYRQVMKRYGLDHNQSDLNIVEVASVVVKKGERNFSATESIFRFIVEASMSRLCSFIFGTALIGACRLYRLTFDQLDLYLEIVTSYPWERKEAFGFAKMFPIYVNLQSVNKKT